MYSFINNGFDYEPPYVPSQTAYDRALGGAYEKGQEAAASHNSTRLTCPYRRSDFAEAWELGYQSAFENIEQALKDIASDIPY